MVKNLVSVIIPYYKNRFFFKECIDSVYSQSYKKKEVFIIYDNEKKDDLNYIKKIISKKKNIKIVINKKNLGAGISRNKGINRSNGEFIAFIDSDDIWVKDKLKKQVSFMRSNNIDLSYTSYQIIDEKNRSIGLRKCQKNISYENLLYDCNIGLSTVIIRKNTQTKNLVSFPKIKTKEDYVLWLKLSKAKIKFMGMKNTLTKWRKTNNSLSSGTYQKFVDGFRVYFIYQQFNFIKSVFYLTILSLNFLKKSILN